MSTPIDEIAKKIDAGEYTWETSGVGDLTQIRIHCAGCLIVTSIIRGSVYSASIQQGGKWWLTSLDIARRFAKVKPRPQTSN